MSDEIDDRPVLSRADQALLKSAHTPTEAQLAASRRALSARIAALTAGGAIASAASTAEATSSAAAASTASAAGATTFAAKSAALLGAAKWISAGMLVGAVAGGTVVATQRSAREETRQERSAQRAKAVAQALAPAPAPIASAPREQPLQAAAITEPVAREAARPVQRQLTRRESAKRSPLGARALEGETLAGELSLLRNARQALEQGDARAALRELDAHSARYAKPVLRQEALAARALALCAADRSTDARRVAAQLERIAPRSPHLIGLADSCALEDE
jgi:hypothetical protein